MNDNHPRIAYVDLLNLLNQGERTDRAVGGGDSMTASLSTLIAGTELGGGGAPGGGTS